MVEQTAAGAQHARQAGGVQVDPLLADVLDHADARDRVERLAGELAIVRDADLDPVGDAGLMSTLARELGLPLRHVIPTTCAPWRAAAWIAKLPHPQPTSSTRSPAVSSSLEQTSSSLVSCASSSERAPREKIAQL